MELDAFSFLSLQRAQLSPERADGICQARIFSMLCDHLSDLAVDPVDLACNRCHIGRSLSRLQGEKLFLLLQLSHDLCVVEPFLHARMQLDGTVPANDLLDLREPALRALELQNLDGFG